MINDPSKRVRKISLEEVLEENQGLRKELEETKRKLRAHELKEAGQWETSSFDTYQEPQEESINWRRR